MRLGISLAITRRGGGSGSEFDIYVDSVSGSDSNDGLTADTPKQTLAGIGTISAGMRIGLARGSTWREALSTTENNVTVAAYGTGTAPQINGADVVTSWTAQGTANVWQATVAHDGSGTDRFRVWEDGSLLVRVADIATCSSTAGSYVDNYASNDPTPAVIYMHPTGSGNPTSNGKSYEVSVRRRGLYLGGTGCTIDGVIARKAMSNNGAIEIGAGTLSKSGGFNGTKHNQLQASGTIEDFLAYQADKPTSYETSSTLMVHYADDVDGLTVTATRVGMSNPESAAHGGISALTMHDSAGNNYASYTGQQIWARGGLLDTGAVSASTIAITGLYADNVSSVIGGHYSLDATYQYYQARHLSSTKTAAIGALYGVGTDTAARTVTIEDSVFYTNPEAQNNNPLIRRGSNWNGLDIVFNNCIFYNDAYYRQIWEDIGTWSSGSLTFNNCIIIVSAFTDVMVIPSGITYVGDNNIYCVRDQTDHVGRLFWKFGATTNNNITDWKTTSGQDANSVAMTSTDLATLWLGTVSDGDFRWNTSGAGLVASGLSVGPRNHWDWNARAVASGPPTAWPTVPTSVAEAITYLDDPAGWDFYP